MVDCVKFAPVLEDENLVRQVLRDVVGMCPDLQLGPLGSVCLGDVEDFASGLGI